MRCRTLSVATKFSVAVCAVQSPELSSFIRTLTGLESIHLFITDIDNKLPFPTPPLPSHTPSNPSPPPPTQPKHKPSQPAPPYTSDSAADSSNPSPPSTLTSHTNTPISSDTHTIHIFSTSGSSPRAASQSHSGTREYTACPRRRTARSKSSGSPGRRWGPRCWWLG